MNDLERIVCCSQSNESPSSQTKGSPDAAVTLHGKEPTPLKAMSVEIVPNERVSTRRESMEQGVRTKHGVRVNDTAMSHCAPLFADIG